MPKRKAPNKRNNNLVIAFDDQARREHLTGFSARKRARRVHGLAQQKRKEQLALRQHRAERKEAEASGPKEEEEEEEEEKKDQHKVEETVVYQDSQTQDQWGGNVIVTATSELPEDESPIRQTGTKGEDTEQEYACSLERFVNQVKGKLPGKRGKKSKAKGSTAAVTKKGGDAKVVAKNLLKQKTRKRKSKKR